MSKEENKVEDNSLEQMEVKYLMGNPPSWIHYFGISIIAVFVALLMILSAIIRYPDTVIAKIFLVTQNPPTRLIAQRAGRIEKLLVQTNDTIEAGEILGVYEHVGYWKDVLELELIVQNSMQEGKFLLSPKKLNVGSLQNTYSILSQDIQSYHLLLTSMDLNHNIKTLTSQIRELRKLNGSLQQQQLFYQEELALAKKDYERQYQLLQNKVIAEREIENSKSKILQMERQAESLESQVYTNELQIRQIEYQIDNLSQTKVLDLENRRIEIRESMAKLLSEIEAWRKNNLIIAPNSGRVSTQKIWSDDQNISVGEEILGILPIQKSRIIGKALISIALSGKVASGMKVLIKLDNYPYREFGMLVGEVSKVALLPQNESYALDVEIPNGLVTTYGKKVIFKQEMQGSAKIITENRSILERIFERLLARFQ